MSLNDPKLQYNLSKTVCNNSLICRDYCCCPDFTVLKNDSEWLKIHDEEKAKLIVDALNLVWLMNEYNLTLTVDYTKLALAGLDELRKLVPRKS